MTNRSATPSRELSLEDLDRVSGAGIKVPDVRKHPDGEAALQLDPNAAGRGIISI
jgi:hypothetical protein